MSEQDQEQKTEEATPKQKEQFKEKGDVAKSQDLSSAVAIATGLGVLVMGWDIIGGGLSRFTSGCLGRLDMHHNYSVFAAEAVITIATVVSPVAIAGVVFGIAIQMAQVGVNFGFKPLEPKLEKFNPFPQMKSMFFSSNTVIEIAKSIVKVIVIGSLATSVLWEEVSNNGALLALTPIEVLLKIATMGARIVITVILALAFLAIIDVLIEKWRHAKKMRMTKEEVKREHKDTDGDPLIKGKIRQKQQEMARSRMLGDVGEADVVVVNPTHYSVAIKYDMAKYAAPVIIAAGVDKLASKIREEARHNSVPVVSDPPLARALYAQGKVGAPIPQDLFSAVASLLAWVYNVTGKM